LERFAQRHQTERHPAHAQHGPIAKPAVDQPPLTLPGTTIQVDTTDWQQIDLDKIADQVASALQNDER
jgi:hypothetical protein